MTVKKVISIILILAIAINIASCANVKSPEWREHLDLGKKYLLDGDYENAIIEFKKAIEIDPKGIRAYIFLAIAYAKIGDYDSAVETLEICGERTGNEFIKTKAKDFRNQLNEEPDDDLDDKLENDGDKEYSADDFKWILDDDGVLTISGSGDMPYYDLLKDDVPWKEKRASITKIVVKDGITSIGDCSFMFCDSLNEVELSDSITNIGEYAFASCGNLSSITMPKSVVIIEKSAFSNCKALTDITIPDSVIDIEDESFILCTNLTVVKISENVTRIGKMAFSGCDNLTIYSPSGSYAEQYAKENDIPFVAE